MASGGGVNTLGVILAGGLARRMGGGDKCLQSLGGRTLLSHVIDRLKPQVDGLILNVNGDPSRFAEYGLPIAPDSVDGFAGPLAGVLAGLDAGRAQGASHIVTAAADTPFFPRNLVECLREAAEEAGAPIALAATPDHSGKFKSGFGRHPTFGIWRVALADDLRAALTDGVRKVVAWTDKHGAATAMFGADPFDPFFNVNTPGDMALAEKLLKKERPE